MSLLNLNVGLLIYQDGPASQNPQIRLADIKWSTMGIPTGNVRQVPIALAPGETMVIASTARALTLNSANVVVTKTAGKMRLTTSLGQRATRSSGDATTAWDITTSNGVTRATASAGTAPNFTGTNVGDYISIVSGFSPFNQGQFTILSKGPTYVEFVNTYAQDELAQVNNPLSIYSSGPVQIGDVLDLTSTSFAFPNQGSFPITAVTDTYIEVLNPNAFPQTITGLSDGLAIYPYAYKWMAIACDRRVLIGLNGQSPSAIEVEPPVEGDLIKTPGIFIKRGKVFQVSVMNVGLQQAQGFLILAE